MLVLDWKAFHDSVDRLANEMRWQWKVEKPKLVAISRGGLIPATILSHALGVPIYHVITAKSYVGAKHTGQTLIQEAAAIPQKAVKDCIFVDDILDTGGTFTQILSKYSDAKFVTPVAKTAGLFMHKDKLLVQPALFVSDDTWVKFPWEI